MMKTRLKKWEGQLNKLIKTNKRHVIFPPGNSLGILRNFTKFLEVIFLNLFTICNCIGKTSSGLPLTSPTTSLLQSPGQPMSKRIFQNVPGNVASTSI